MPNFAQKKRAGYFNISNGLKHLHFHPGKDDWRVHTSGDGSVVKLFILQKRRWMTISNSNGHRMMTCLQPRTQKQLELLLTLSRVNFRDVSDRLVRTDNEVDFNKI